MDLKKLSNNDLCKEYQKYIEKLQCLNPRVKDISRFSDITSEICERFLANWYEEK